MWTYTCVSLCIYFAELGAEVRVKHYIPSHFTNALDMLTHIYHSTGVEIRGHCPAPGTGLGRLGVEPFSQPYFVAVWKQSCYVVWNPYAADVGLYLW